MPNSAKEEAIAGYNGIEVSALCHWAPLDSESPLTLKRSGSRRVARSSVSVFLPPSRLYELKGVDEKESRFDPAKKENRNPLFVPLGVVSLLLLGMPTGKCAPIMLLTAQDLSIHIAVRNKTMPHDLAFEISFDGRLVYTFFVKHGNHGTRRISHFFSEIGGYVHKVPFHASRIVSDSISRRKIFFRSIC